MFGLREKKKGVAWRLALAAQPWTAAWVAPDGRELFTLRSGEQRGEVAATREAGGAPAVFQRPDGDDALEVAVNGEGFFVWPAAVFAGPVTPSTGGNAGGGGGGQGSLAPSPPAAALLHRYQFPSPMSPAAFRHLRLKLTGGAALGAAAPPPAHLRGFVAPAALAAIAKWSHTSAARAENASALQPAAVENAERRLHFLTVFHASFAREEVQVPGVGAFGVVASTSAAEGGGGGASGGGASGGGASGGGAPVPPAALRLRPSGVGGGPGGEGVSSPAPFTPAIVAPVACPNSACHALLAVDVPPTLAPNRGLHLSCTVCGGGLCGHCGAPWNVPGAPAESHAGVPCSEHGESVRRAAAGGVDEALGAAAKRCPNPTCRTPVVRYRGHACHAVTCGTCRLEFCYCCLATAVEKGRSAHEGCPAFCSDACDCQPCPTCALGRPCDHCNGMHAGTGCPSCRLRRVETPAEAGARVAAMDRAVAAIKARNSHWSGPRRFRTDVPAGLPRGAAAVVGVGEATSATAARAGARRNPWLTACLSTELVGPAAAAREGLQLIDMCFNEMGLLAAPPPPHLREYLVRNSASGAAGLFRGGALVLVPADAPPAPPPCAADSDIPPGTLGAAAGALTLQRLQALPSGTRFSWGPWAFQCLGSRAHFWTHALIGQPEFVGVELLAESNGYFYVQRGGAVTVTYGAGTTNPGPAELTGPQSWQQPAEAHAVPTSLLAAVLEKMISWIPDRRDVWDVRNHSERGFALSINVSGVRPRLPYLRISVD